MYPYGSAEWILFFYIYCMIGWIWETCYVSVKERQFVNRGFMHGPFLPIYGTGAVIILLATIPVKQSMILVFLFGMIAATALEYVTGAVMEWLFHVRYWDYSSNFLNVNGHICLKCSLAWGVFSVLMIRFIHVPIEHVVRTIPKEPERILTYVVTIVVVADFAISFREAMDFRHMLETLTENNEEVRRMVKRMEVRSAFVQDDVRQIKEAVNEKMEDGAAYADLVKSEISDRAEIAKQELAEKADATKQEIMQRAETAKQELSAKLEQLRSTHSYQRVNGIMKRNSVVAVERYKEALEQLKK